MTCKLAAGNTRTKNTQSTLDYLGTNSEYYLPSNHTVCDLQCQNLNCPVDKCFPEAPVCTNILHPSLPHNLSHPFLCYLRKISTCMWKGQVQKGDFLEMVRAKIKVATSLSRFYSPGSYPFSSFSSLKSTPAL